MVSMHYLVGSDCSLVQCFISQALTPFQPHLQATYLPFSSNLGTLESNLRCLLHAKATDPAQANDTRESIHNFLQMV